MLPAPKAVDWDGDGKANAADEWIEIHNASAWPVDLSGWRLETGKGGGINYRIPRGMTLRAGAILAFYQRQTRPKLDDAGGTVRLVDRGGKVADTVRYGALSPTPATAAMRGTPGTATGRPAPAVRTCRLPRRRRP